VCALESRHVLQTYKRAPVVFTRGEGVHLFDDSGKAYLDLISGVGVASLGHANPLLAAALADQAQTLVHTSNLYYHGLQGRVASRLASLSGLPRAFFCNSGTEAMEGCLKFARRYWHTAGDTGRTGFVALEHAFHGRTMGALSVTWTTTTARRSNRCCRMSYGSRPTARSPWRRLFPARRRRLSSRPSRARVESGRSARRLLPP